MRALAGVLVALAAVTLCGCGGGSDEQRPSTNHVVEISNLTHRCAAQALRLEVESAGGGYAETVSFVLNAGATRDVPVTLPAAGSYELRVWVARAGSEHSMWWDSVAMEPSGKTSIQLLADGDPIHFYGNAAGLPNDGSDIPDGCD